MKCLLQTLCTGLLNELLYPGEENFLSVQLGGFTELKEDRLGGRKHFLARNDLILHKFLPPLTRT